MATSKRAKATQMTDTAHAASACPFNKTKLLDPDFVQNPYPYLAAARATQPVYFNEETNLWIITKHADVKRVLDDPTTFSSKNVQKPLAPLCPAAQQIFIDANFSPSPLTSVDGAVHANLRRHAVKGLALTPRLLSRIQPDVSNATHRLIDTFISRGTADLVEEMTSVLPATVIFSILGFPAADHRKLLDWCTDQHHIKWRPVSDEGQIESAKGTVAFWDYCAEFVEQCIVDAPDNATGALLQAHYANPELLTQKDVTSIVFGMVFAGQETTANLMSAALYLLLSNRSQWEKVGKDRTLVPGVVEESVRLEPPVFAWRRITTQPVELGGASLPAGAELLLHLGSSGRDEDVFAQSDEFAPDRSDVSQHLSFGHGIHSCIGSVLARFETRILIETLLDRIPSLRLAPDWVPSYEPTIVFRTLKTLQAEWDVKH
jgi:cytochrome P450